MDSTQVSKRRVSDGIVRAASRSLCDSPLASPLRNLWARNQANSHMQLSAAQKAALGLYLVLRDWSYGDFPPRFERQSAWANERNFATSLSGLTSEQVAMLSNKKPFDFNTDELEIHTRNLIRMRAILRAVSITPPASILELGCGQGWLSEMLAMMGFHVLGTSIAPGEIEEAGRRAAAFKLRNIPGSLSFNASPMELGHEQHLNFDCAIVYEALHHAFDWREAIQSVALALRPGGWFLICAEPNLAHTLISYRVGKLTRTHEIGLSRRLLKKELGAAGFAEVRTFSSPLHFWLGWHWLAARRGSELPR